VAPSAKVILGCPDITSQPSKKATPPTKTIFVPHLPALFFLRQISALHDPSQSRIQIRQNQPFPRPVKGDPCSTSAPQLSLCPFGRAKLESLSPEKPLTNGTEHTPVTCPVPQAADSFNAPRLSPVNVHLAPLHNHTQLCAPTSQLLTGLIRLSLYIFISNSGKHWSFIFQSSDPERYVQRFLLFSISLVPPNKSFQPLLPSKTHPYPLSSSALTHCSHPTVFHQWSTSCKPSSSCRVHASTFWLAAI